jgi:hypothetical protein
MREIRSYGSVRGVVGDRYPYRDSQKTTAQASMSVTLNFFSFKVARIW